MNRACVLLTSVLTLGALTSDVISQTTLPADQPLKGALLEGMGKLHHPVSTTNPEAQKFFDQGLSLLYGFNHDEAMRSFMRAAELDEKLGMAHWGIALTLGPNYNVPVDATREKAAHEHIQKAMALTSGAPQVERDYIAALARRYSDDPKADLKKLDADYRAAMRDLCRKYPDDLDAATLYAESIMMLRPWQLWTFDGKPVEDTPELVTVLESVLRRDPDHLGANHFYIHAVEASRTPERALEAAGRLPALAPAMGHVVHMPSHIYARVGDHEASVSSNALAAEVDREYMKSRDDCGIYPMMYYSHNLHFLTYSNVQQGRFVDAMNAAELVHKHTVKHAQHTQMMEVFAIAPELVLARFGKWDKVLKLPEPDDKLLVSRYSWHIARSIAWARSGDPEQAERDRQAAKQIAQTIPPEAMFGMLNPASKVIDLADNYLAARVAQAKNDSSSAVALFTKAAELEDALNYDEPPSWWLHVREALGAELLRSGKAVEAEAVFRRDLEWNVKNARSLFGLRESLRAQGKAYDAQWVEREFKSAWKNADTPLRIEDL